MYPVYGFGGKVKLPNGSLSPVQHSFPVNLYHTCTRWKEAISKYYASYSALFPF